MSEDVIDGAQRLDVKALPGFAVARAAAEEAEAASQKVPEITDEASLKAVIELLGTLSHARKLIDAERTAASQPHHETWKMILAEFNELSAPIKGREAMVKEAIEEYNAEQKKKADDERKRQERLARERQEREDVRAEKEEREPIEHKPPPVPEPPKTMRADSGAKVTMRKQRTFEIVDEGQLPREYLTPDMQAIRKAVNAGVTEIPGVKVDVKEVPVSSL